MLVGNMAQAVGKADVGHCEVWIERNGLPERLYGLGQSTPVPLVKEVLTLQVVVVSLAVIGRPRLGPLSVTNTRSVSASAGRSWRR